MPAYVKTLSEDVTLADITNTLNDPEDFVRRAFGNLHSNGGASSGLVLRIGRMGGGKAPNYRIDRPEPGFTLGADPAPDRHAHVADYNGKSHKPLIAGGEAVDVLREEHWSKVGMTYAQVRELLGRIRKL